jgi:hypothetical protein
MHTPLITRELLPNFNNISIEKSSNNHNENKIINRIKLEDSIDSLN